VRFRIPHLIRRMSRTPRYITTLVLPPHMAEHVKRQAEQHGTTQAAFIRLLVYRDIETTQAAAAKAARAARAVG
jgi:hypothetical protein